MREKINRKKSGYLSPETTVIGVGTLTPLAGSITLSGDAGGNTNDNADPDPGGGGDAGGLEWGGCIGPFCPKEDTP